MITVRGWLGQNPVLAWTAALQVALAICALIAMPFDHRTILGINPWIKPLKFDVSVGIMLITLAAILSGLQGFNRSRLWIGAGIGIALSIEDCIISLQSVRGVRSHMNYSTPLDAHLFECMAVFILIGTLLFVWTLGLVVLDPTRWPPAVAWGVRLGLLTLLAGSLEGVLMVWFGAHTVGAKDGLRGLPLVKLESRSRRPSDSALLRAARTPGLSASRMAIEPQLLVCEAAGRANLHRIGNVSRRRLALIPAGNGRSPAAEGESLVVIHPLLTSIRGYSCSRQQS